MTAEGPADQAKKHTYMSASRVIETWLTESGMRILAGAITNANLVVESGANGNKCKATVTHEGNKASKKDAFGSAFVAAYLRQST